MHSFITTFAAPQFPQPYPSPLPLAPVTVIVPVPTLTAILPPQQPIELVPVLAFATAIAADLTLLIVVLVALIAAEPIVCRSPRIFRSRYR